MGVNFHDREDASIAETLKEDLIDHMIELKFNISECVIVLCVCRKARFCGAFLFQYVL